MSQLVERTPALTGDASADASVDASAEARATRRLDLPDNGFTRWLGERGHILLAVVGALAFMVIRPPVADLQAADARAAAAGRHVGLGYWLSWFGGSTPGQYSILTPLLASALGVTTIAGLSVLGIATIARPLLAGTARPTSGAYLVVASALANLWSGRVPFSVGIAVSLTGLLLLLRGRPLLGGVVNGAATVFSPLGPAFILLAIVGPAFAKREWRTSAIIFAIPSVLGLIIPSMLFGAPAAMPFAWTTLAWTVGIVLAASLLDLPREIKYGLWAAVIASVGAFVIPSGVGANISRYAFLLLPPIVWAAARNPRKVIVLGLLPAFVYSGYLVARDLEAASQPSAQQTYYTGLRAELATLPDRDNQRVEVLDTATHRAAVELVPEVYLARGWETQSDSSNNAIFYNNALLNPISYREWLDDNAVAWVAVPTAPGAGYQSEAALIKTGLPYLNEFWHDEQWTLYAVSTPSEIVPAPATVVSSTETRFVFDLTQAATLHLSLRPARFLHITNLNPLGPQVCLSSNRPDEINATFAAAGRYVLTSGFAVTSSVHASCPAP
ncbi:MAG: hypothetical protein JWO63_1500 [Frankiales bacterium]|nr:hypothetical protein [Frankiales bacterium]